MTSDAAEGAGSAPTRTRDPSRGEKILGAAAALIPERGYHAVSMANIGAASVGSGVYRQ